MSVPTRSFRSSCPIIKVPAPMGHTLASLKKLYPRCPECDRNWPKTPDDDSRSCRSRTSVTMRLHTTTGAVAPAPGNRSKAPAPAPWESPSSGRNKSPTRKPTGIPSRTRSYPPRHSCCSENEDPTSDLDATNRPQRRMSSVTKPNYGATRNLKPNETYSVIEPNEVNACCQDSAGSLDNSFDEPCCSHDPSFWWRFRSFFSRKHRNKRRARRSSITWSRTPSICYIPDK